MKQEWLICAFVSWVCKIMGDEARMTDLCPFVGLGLKCEENMQLRDPAEWSWVSVRRYWESYWRHTHPKICQFRLFRTILKACHALGIYYIGLFWWFFESSQGDFKGLARSCHTHGRPGKIWTTRKALSTCASPCFRASGYRIFGEGREQKDCTHTVRRDPVPVKGSSNWPKLF